MIDIILVPLDGSELAEATLPYASAVQRAFSSKLILLRVLGAGRNGSDGVEWRLYRAEARSYLEGIVDDLHREGIDAEAIVAAGKPSEAILEIARERKVDLVLLTSHGAGGPSRFGVSGTAHKVLSSGTTSVLLVRVAEDARSSWSAGLKTILVPTDGSRRSEWALCLAASVARSSGSELLLLRVLPRPGGMLPGCSQAEMEQLLEASQKSAEERMAVWMRKLTAPDLRVRSQVVVAASIPRTIDEVALREDASLVVLSAHGSAADAGWPYGSVSGAVLHHGTTPVLVFQDAPTRKKERNRDRGARRRRRYSNHPVWIT